MAEFALMIPILILLLFGMTFAAFYAFRTAAVSGSRRKTALSEKNAHPHVCHERVAVVHNGIIENHDALRAQQQQTGYRFTSQTDTEVIVHQIDHYLDQGKDLLEAVRLTVADLDGAFALGVINREEPGRMIAARRGSPLVVGVGNKEHFVASDSSPLVGYTDRIVYLADRLEKPVLVEGPADESNARPSADGRFICYQSDETGKPQIYVNRFPQGGRKLQVSIDGGENWFLAGKATYSRSTEQASN